MQEFTHGIIYLDYLGKGKEFISLMAEISGKNPDQFIVVDESGIAKAINAGLRKITTDLVTILANDIEEPVNWMVKRESFPPGYGVIAIPQWQILNWGNEDIIGNFTITRECLNKVGAFNEHFDPYGAIDLDYCHRVRAAGFKTGYIPNELCIHRNINKNDAYGYSKSDLVQKTWMDHVSDVSAYANGSKQYYIQL